MIKARDWNRGTVLGLLGAAVLIFSGCGTNTASNPQGKTGQQPLHVSKQTPGKPTNAVSNAASIPTVTLQVLTGKMSGKAGWPKFLPANFTVPAGKTVRISIVNYDDGSAPLPNGLNKVTGTVGNQEFVDGKPFSSIPLKSVAHTLTVPGIGLNVPIPVRTKSERFNVISFTFHTPNAKRTLNWQCMAACGSGSTGWSGAMAQPGYMKGTITVS